MNVKRMMYLLAIACLAGGLMLINGCGGKKEVRPVATPVPFAAATPEEKPEAQRYSVVRGDTLWGISGKSDIYNDFFQWPLIFKANRDQIQDPDIIDIGQDFVISREFSQDEVRRAIKNAKNTPRYKPHTKPRKRLPIEY